MSSGQVYSPIGYKIQIKRTVVDALRTYMSSSQSNTVNQTKVTVEYPQSAESYPALIVGYEQSQLYHTGLGHVEYIDGNLHTRWTFEGSVSMEILALTSLERDYISDHITNLAAFRTYIGSTFELDVILNENIDLQMNLGLLQPGPEQVMSGASWGLTDTRFYQCSYSFPVLGTFVSAPLYYDWISRVNTFTGPEGYDDFNSVPPQ